MAYEWIWQDTGRGSGYWYNTRTGERRWAGKGDKPGNPERRLCFSCGKPTVFERKGVSEPHEYDICIECGEGFCPECIDWAKMALLNMTAPLCKACAIKKSNLGNPGSKKGPFPVPIDKPVKSITAPREVYWAIFVPGVGIDHRRQYKSEESAWKAIEKMYGTKSGNPGNPTYVGEETITPKYETRYAKGFAINIPVSLGIPKEQEETERFKYEMIMKRYQNKENWKMSPTPFETINPQDAQLVARAFTYYLGGAEITQVDNKLTVTSKGYYHYVGG